MDLEKRWMALMAGANQTDAAVAFEALRNHYTGRPYHNLGHIAQCLDELDKSELTYRRAVELALWYHDVIYDPKRSDNEEESATFASTELRNLGEPRHRRSEVERLILLTTHKENAKRRGKAAQLIVDIDLRTLGGSAQEYEAYAKSIRREYDWVPEADYIKGRTAVLQSFLDRPRIYYTDRFRSLYEQAARQNLAEEIKRLNQA